MRMTLAEIMEATGALGDLPGEGRDVVTRVATDSRLVQPGELFVCLSGRRFDGHRFAADAAKKGAAAILAAQPLPEIASTPVFLVRDTLDALGRLAAHWRLRFSGKMVAVTGSAGKTTVKEMCAAICSVQFKTAKNYKNFNNQLGLPLSILAADGDEEAWIMELGINRPGDMDDLGAIARPDVAVIHNIGPAHLEGLGDLDGVARQKTALLGYVRSGGVALVNIDYPELKEAAAAHDTELATISTSDPSARFLCSYLGPAEDAMGRFRLVLDGTEMELDLPFVGAHMAENIAAAAGAAILAGADVSAVARGLSGPCGVDQRFQCIKRGPYLFIDDTYNANPLSMRRAVRCAAELAGSRPLVAIVGDMLELGAEAGAAHRELGRDLAEAAPVAVLYRGDHADDVFQGLGNGRFVGSFVKVREPADTARAWAELGLGHGVVLAKGSRSLQMEDHLRAVMRETPDPDAQEARG